MKYTKDWFVENIHLCQSGLYGLAISILRNEEDAKDAVAESIYKAFYNIENLRDPYKFKPWIMKILTNTAYEMIREREYTENIDNYNNTLESPHLVDISTKITLWDAVQSLGELYSPLVILFYYEEIPIKEIAKILDITPVTARKRLSRARKKLRIILEGKEVSNE